MSSDLSVPIMLFLSYSINRLTGTDGFRALCHQFFPSCLPRLATCLSGFKNVRQRAQAFASQLLSLQRLCHLQSKYQMLFLQAADFRTDTLSSQYRYARKRARTVWEGGNRKGPRGTSLVPYFILKPSGGGDSLA